MKRLLLLVAVLMFATAAFAGTADRDMLILSNGTVYSVSSEPLDDERGSPRSSLAFTVQANGETTRAMIAESVDTGVNSHPTLVHDPATDTLYLAWLRMMTPSTSELMVAAYRDGKWESATSVDYKSAIRYNLSVGITRRIQQVQRDGSMVESPAVVLHAAWYEQGENGNGPRYAVMGLGGGNTVSIPDIHNLTEFADNTGGGVSAAQLNQSINRDFLRHVAVLTGPTPDAVDVVFADPRTNNFHRATLRPISNVRIHIPVGNRGGAPKIGGPKKLSIDWTGRTSTIESADGKTLIFCNATDERIDYVKFSNGEWSTPQSVSLGEKVTLESAMAALARMAVAAE